MLIPFLRRDVLQMCQKRGCVSLYTEDVLWVTPSVSVHTHPRVGHAPATLSPHVFACFVLSLCLHTASLHGCFDTIQDKMSRTRQGYLGDVCCVMQINTQKMRLSVQIHSLPLDGGFLPSCFHRGRCFMGRVVLGAAPNRTGTFWISVCVHLNHRPKGVPAWEELCFALCEEWWIILQLQWIYIVAFNKD